MTKYFGSFLDFEDMLAAWGDISPTELRPSCDSDVLFASYGDEDYEGVAIVIFGRDGKIYEVNGSHCSCHGLSEESHLGGNSQWHAEETTIQALGMRDLHLNLDDSAAAIDAWRLMFGPFPESSKEPAAH